MDTNPKKPSSNRIFILVQAMTVSRIPLALAFGVLLHHSEYKFWSVFICLFLLAIIELSDAIDGFIARRSGVTSEWGAMLDPYADSISRLIIYFSLAINSQRLTIIWLPIIMALRDITVAYSRIVLTKKGKSVKAKWSGKWKARFQAVGAFLLLLGPAYWGFTGEWLKYFLSWVILLVTAAYAFQYVQSAKHAFEE